MHILLLNFLNLAVGDASEKTLIGFGAAVATAIIYWLLSQLMKKRESQDSLEMVLTKLSVIEKANTKEHSILKSNFDLKIQELLNDTGKDRIGEDVSDIKKIIIGMEKIIIKLFDMHNIRDSEGQLVWYSNSLKVALEQLDGTLSNLLTFFKETKTDSKDIVQYLKKVEEQIDAVKMLLERKR